MPSDFPAAHQGDRPASSRGRKRSSWLYRKLRRFKLVRIFRKDRPFAFLFAVGTVIAAAVGVSVLHLWNTAPKGFSKGAIKVSLIDLIQASSLARSARAAAAAGQYETALYTWQSAVANNQGDARLYRGLLGFLREIPEARSEHAALVKGATSWLLELSGTNRLDAVLAADVLDKFGLSRQALAELAPFPVGEFDEVERVRARCLLGVGAYADFDRLWRSHEAGWASDPRMARCRDAWRVVADDGAGGLEAALRLKQALTDPGPEGLFAARLLHEAAARRGLVEEVGLCLARLEAAHSDAVAHHVHYWRLLHAAGRGEEARTRARNFPIVPRDPESAVFLVDVLRVLDLPGLARTNLGLNLAAYGKSVQVWRSYFDLVADAADWKELRRASADARLLASRNDALYAEALFAEYRASRAEDRQREADELIREMLALRLVEPDSALRFAPRWRLDGRAPAALAVLAAAESELSGRTAYWQELFQVAWVLRDMERLRTSVAEMVRLDPGSAVWKSNRAALLLVTGENPAEALQLTMEGLQRSPASLPLRLNHAVALFMNGRIDDAAAALERIPGDRLDPDATAAFHLAVAEVRARQGRKSEARAAAVRVDRERLLPPQVERLEKVLRDTRAE